MDISKNPSHNSERTFYPGFDWLKLIGCVIVVVSHAFLNDWVNHFHPTTTKVLNNMIPCFFIVAGFLMCKSLSRRENKLRHILHYVGKYLGFMYVLNTAGLIYLYADRYIQTGEFHLHEAITRCILSPLITYAPFQQLWFIAPLCLGIAICSICHTYKKDRQMRCVLTVLFPVILFASSYCKLIPGAIRFYEANLTIFRNLFAAYTGVLYTAVGMWAAEHEEAFLRWKWYRLLPVVIPVSMIELYIVCVLQPIELRFCYLLVCAFYPALLLFRGLLKIQNTAIQRHHFTVTVFSGTTFFLHEGGFLTLEKIGIPRGIGSCLIILAGTSALTAAIAYWHKRKHCA